MLNNESVLCIKNSSGKHVSLLNENTSLPSLSAFKVHTLETSLNLLAVSKRKYHCDEPGCHKSFTTSGHLARHNRIHTGEKNFHCLQPGCLSRFSRQDNMMQHYRTHLSQKERRQAPSKRETLKTPGYCRSQEKRTRAKAATRPRRSTTMPSLPYPAFEDRPSVRPRRALSNSSASSSASSMGSSYPSPPFHAILPPPIFHHPHPHYPHHYSYTSTASSPNNSFHLPYPSPPTLWESKPSEKPSSGLVHLANIVSTFG
ncbi:hypothetical protein BY458DRAFT_475790 [Sporodiniella umbellata]|nr:hypothetical protein BY458DRAFT_475790 [Sporodiniella umbellata]